MGVDTRLYIASKWQVSDIKKVLERTFNVTASVEMPLKDTCNYFRLNFTAPDGENRSMSIHTQSSHNGFECTTLSLGCGGMAIEIMQALADTFGGFLQKYDSDETYHGIRGKLDDCDNLPFWIKDAILAGIDPDSLEELKAHIAKTTARWKSNGL
jgi:hypothetical protein